MKEYFQKITVRSIVIVIFVLGAFYLALIDASFRPSFSDLSKVAIGGYFGQMLPKRNQ